MSSGHTICKGAFGLLTVSLNATGENTDGLIDETTYKAGADSEKDTECAIKTAIITAANFNTPVCFSFFKFLKHLFYLQLNFSPTVFRFTQLIEFCQFFSSEKFW